MSEPDDNITLRPRKNFTKATHVSLKDYYDTDVLFVLFKRQLLLFALVTNTCLVQSLHPVIQTDFKVQLKLLYLIKINISSGGHDEQKSSLSHEGFPQHSTSVCC